MQHHEKPKVQIVIMITYKFFDLSFEYFQQNNKTFSLPEMINFSYKMLTPNPIHCWKRPNIDNLNGYKVDELKKKKKN